jgi:transcriptional regulator of acetoin/glycerol metabolism
LKADDALSFNPVSSSHIKQALDQNHDLIQSAKPELDRLGRAIAGTQFFALITDAQGVLLDLGGAPRAGSSEQMRVLVDSEIVKWRKVVNDAKIPRQ